MCELDDSFGNSFVKITLVAKLESCARHFECDANHPPGLGIELGTIQKLGDGHGPLPLRATRLILSACQSGDGLSTARTRSRLIQPRNTIRLVRVIPPRHGSVVKTAPRAEHVATEQRDERVFKRSHWLSGHGDEPDDPDRTVFGTGARGSDPRPQTAGPSAAFGWICHCCPARRDLLGSSRYRPHRFQRYRQTAQSQPKGQG